MATKKKLLQAAAGNAGGEVLNVEDVFSTYLYTGTGSTQTITNGIDLAGEGGLVWTKRRAGGNSSYSDHWLVDSERGDSYGLRSNLTNAQFQDSSLGFSSSGYTAPNSIHFTQNATDYASWTFRKAPKFFDVVTYSGTGSAGLTVNHNLGSVPGCIWVKRLDAGDGFQVYHRGSNASAPEDYKASLNDTAAFSNDTMWNDFAPTATQFQLGARDAANRAGTNYVAYLFAHNDGDGKFGPDADADIIKCGSYTGTGAGGHEVDIGFEPQWLLTKRADSTGSWYIVDNMRGFTAYPATSYSSILRPNSSDSENQELGGAYWQQHITPTGFVMDSASGSHNASGGNYIYIAIRRGTAVPESATEVYANQFGSASPQPWFKSSFPPDMALYKRVTGTGNWSIASRLTGPNDLNTNSTGAEQPNSSARFDFQNGFYASSGSTTDWMSWHWKRAKGAFDVVAYTGTGSARTVAHNLGVAPEMMWVKRRNSTGEWPVYHKDLSIGNRGLVLQSNSGTYASEYWNSQNPTSTTFPLGTSSNVNASGSTYIAYLFASLDGVSKVGSYTGNGSTQTIDCGFSAGARFVLIKKTNGSGSWLVFDTERGIVSGNDPYLELNETATQNSTTDYMDPDNSGFALTQNGLINGSSDTYIFYAIA